MFPSTLEGWEVILRSQFALCLLLLAAVIVLLRRCAKLEAEKDQVTAMFRDYLLSQDNFARVIANFRRIQSLTHSERKPRQ